MQMTPQMMQERMPYVQFEERSVEYKDAVGNIFYKLVDFAVVTPVGTKDRVEKIVAEWFPQMKQLEKMERWNPTWTLNLKAMYDEWKKTNQTPLNGTPVINWPLLSKAQVTLLKAANILTIEDLAQANEEGIGRLGMGGRNLVQLARNWLDASGSGAADLSRRALALDMTNQELLLKIKEKDEQIRLLEAKIAASPGNSDQSPHQPSLLVDADSLRAAQSASAEAEFDKILG